MKGFVNIIFGKLKDPWVIGVVILAFFLGFFFRGGDRSDKVESDKGRVATSQKETKWTCAMHPQIQLNKPGDCPLCGMDLIPVQSDMAQAGGGERQIVLSESARKLAEIVTSLVERKFVEKEIRMAGKVDFDETNVGYITAYVGGRLDRLYVDYTGVYVKKGDHMVNMYSPELLAAQEELIQALKVVTELEKSDVKILRDTALSTVESVREKLRLWGLTLKQIQEIEERGVPTDHITIYSPMEGIVIDKNAVEGKYVQTGSRIYTIADLSKVWVKLDAYDRCHLP